MSKIDLIIDALKIIKNRKECSPYMAEQALAAARELKALKPVAIRNPINGIIEIQWGASAPLGTKLYALDEVTK